MINSSFLASQSEYTILAFHDKGMLLAGGCGDTNGKPRIAETEYLDKAYQMGKALYS